MARFCGIISAGLSLSWLGGCRLWWSDNPPKDTKTMGQNRLAKLHKSTSKNQLYDQTIRERLKAAVAVGMPVDLACNFARVSPHSIYAWKRKFLFVQSVLDKWDSEGADEDSLPYLSEHDLSAYELFVDLYEVAAEAIHKWLQGIEVAGKKDWRAYSWMLAKVQPSHFGNEVSDDDSDEVVVKVIASSSGASMDDL